MQAYPRTSGQQCQALLSGRHPAPGHGAHRPGMGRGPGLHPLRERPGAPARALARTASWLFAVNTPDNRLEVFHVTRPRPRAPRPRCPSAWSPWRWRRAATTRSGSSTTSPTASASSRSTASGSSGRVVAHPARRRRAARHRLRGPGQQPRLHHHRAPRPERPVRPAAHHAGRRPRRRLGVRRRATWAASLGGDPLTIITLFTDTPRALAVTPDGTRVYAAGFHYRQPHHEHHRGAGPRRCRAPAASPGRTPTSTGVPAPEVGLIVKYNGQHWVDELGRAWDDKVALLPARQGRVRHRRHGQPAARSSPGAARLLHRRRHHPLQHGRQPGEREGLRLATPRRQQPRASRARASSPAHACAGTCTRAASPCSARRQRRRRGTSTSTSTTTPAARRCPTPRTSKSLALPHGHGGDAQRQRRCTSRRSARARSASIDTAAARERHLRAEHGEPDSRCSGGGPTGLVLDEARDRLYVLTRFDNAISVIDTDHAAARSAHVAHAQPRAAERRRRAPLPLRRRAHARATATRPARAATSSATSTAWPGTSATPTAP